MRFNSKAMSLISELPSSSFDLEGVLEIFEKSEGIFKKQSGFYWRKLFFFFKHYFICIGFIDIIVYCTCIIENNLTL